MEYQFIEFTKNIINNYKKQKLFNPKLSIPW